MSNPYRGLPDHQFWRRGVSGVEHHLLDPIVSTKFKIQKTDKVATAGSCFAQHISRRLKGIGFNYFVTEDGGDLSDTDKQSLNYGTFSARFGNLYTTAQLLQLFKEALGQATFPNHQLKRPDGRYVDSFRQQIDPGGYDSPAAVVAERDAHLAAVRRMFLECDIFIFTLGLTESWRSKADGSVLPIAPGVVGGSFSPDEYEFVNFSASEVREDLEDFITRLKAINPGVRVLLTVSPVPLIATYEKKHVLVATTYSKSVLRVAAEEVVNKYDFLDYFPSYEIITGSFSGGLYYEDDYREVNSIGVSHAMRCFLNNYTVGGRREPVVSASAKTAPSTVICDEEAIAAMR